MGKAARHLDTVLGQLPHFSRVVGHQLNRMHGEAADHVSGNGVVSFIVSEAESDVGLNGVESLVLELIGAYFVDETYPPTFLTKVKDEPAI